MVEILAGGEGAKENDLEVDSGNGCDDDNGCHACHRNGGGASLSARTMLFDPGYISDFGLRSNLVVIICTLNVYTI